MKYRALLLLSLFWANPGLAQQMADPNFKPKLNNPTYPIGQGTKIFIDEGHSNFHTREGRYISFAQLLERDGYQVLANPDKFSAEVLKDKKILVIANAESDGVSHPIVTPTKSAFTETEIQALKDWVNQGGALFLIADHMPFAGAAAPLAQAFGFEFFDAYVLGPAPQRGQIEFSREKKNLADHPLTQGRSEEEQINQVRSFTGQGFKIPSAAQSILDLDASQWVFMVDTMGVINDQVERFSAEGLSQGAVMKYGKGRMAVFGEAAMFSAQLAGKKKIKMGMNAKNAKENYQFLLNIIHWLDGKLD